MPPLPPTSTLAVAPAPTVAPPVDARIGALQGAGSRIGARRKDAPGHLARPRDADIEAEAVDRADIMFRRRAVLRIEEAVERLARRDDEAGAARHVAFEHADAGALRLRRRGQARDGEGGERRGGEEAVAIELSCLSPLWPHGRSSERTPAHRTESATPVSPSQPRSCRPAAVRRRAGARPHGLRWYGAVTSGSRRTAGSSRRPLRAGRSMSRRTRGNSGPVPKAEPCTTATPSVSSSAPTKSVSVSMTLPSGVLRPMSIRAGREDVERAFRARAFQALRLVQHGDDEVAALLEDLAARRDEVLRAVERLDRRPLRDRAGARSLLALDHVHRLDERLGAGGVADAPAGHRIGFRDAVHRQRAVVERRLDLGRRDELEVAIGQVLVHVVGQHPDMRDAAPARPSPSSARPAYRPRPRGSTAS